MKKLAIYYIATSNYKNGFSTFVDSIEHFMPDVHKTIFCLSDGLEAYDGYNVKNLFVTVRKIDHLPWPLVALLKFHYIYKHRNDNFDYACYCNADLQFNTDCTNYRFNENKINLCAHVNSFGFEVVDNFKFEYTKNPKSTAYIENPYKYCMSGFVYGLNRLFIDMCKDIADMIDKDLMNNIIAERHDESYLNKWAVINKDKCCMPVKFMTRNKYDSYSPFIIKDTFIKDKDIIH